MTVVRLNDVSISIKKRTAFIHDIFNDVSQEEIECIKKYLIAEGFISEKTKIYITAKKLNHGLRKK